MSHDAGYVSIDQITRVHVAVLHSGAKQFHVVAVHTPDGKTEVGRLQLMNRAQAYEVMVKLMDALGGSDAFVNADAIVDRVLAK
jgi:hypothetical protein